MSGTVMSGRLIAVVGPSGVGKDSVMQALSAADNSYVTVKRVITRAANAGGEDYDAVSEDAFAQMVLSGAFVLNWAAHGLRYGVPKTIETDFAPDKALLVNLSRSVLREAQDKFQKFTVVNLTAPPDVLADRLAARGRETTDMINARLSRASFALPHGLKNVIHVSNGGPLSETVARLTEQLQPESIKR